MYQKYAANNAPEGKYRIAGENGLPEWAHILPPTKEELQQYAENKKQQFIIKSSEKIAPLQDAVDLGIATEDEKEALLSWKKYRVTLNRIDIEQAFAIECPEQPK
ncbi:tail fiber assembly protein [Photorhabdus stackebrandtii]|uniref:Phage tail protein n=1 Tax=Photorhabdus stackebrandtii TaxID=1123042 RepID=A0A7X5TMC5_9GAMM|nr:phage tail protein [Photorhabdus stackebrandtii]